MTLHAKWVDASQLPAQGFHMPLWGWLALGAVLLAVLLLLLLRRKTVKFETFGCGSAIASSSMATEMIKGKRIEDALALTNKEVVDALGGLPAHKLHCSVLAEEAVKSAVKDYYDKNGIAYDKSKFPACEDCESCRMV